MWHVCHAVQYYCNIQSTSETMYYIRHCITNISVGLPLIRYSINLTAAVAQWLERSPREREVVGSIPDRVIPKTL